MPPLATPAEKHAAFLFRQHDPPNGGPPPELMLRDFTTAPDLFYIRNHGPTPDPDPAAYRLRVSGLIGRELSLSLEDLRRNFPAHTVPATLQCAGNRRTDLIRVAPIPGEVPWGGEAISHAEWTGARLRDVLAAAGIKETEARHVEFLGLDHARKEGKSYDFGGSIPVDKALAPETLLAYAMNGAPLPALHGFPVRAIVPGYIGARSVKWLAQVVVRADPSPNQFQAKQYRLYPADARAETADPARGLPLGETAVNADICRVTLPAAADESTVVCIEGWAIGGGGRSVARVEVSADDGVTWTQAVFTSPDAGPYAWRFWRAGLPGGHVPAHGIVARAWDTAANVQPENPASLWNFKGYANNAWPRWPVPLTLMSAGPVREIEYFI